MGAQDHHISFYQIPPNRLDLEGSDRFLSPAPQLLGHVLKINLSVFFLLSDLAVNSIGIHNSKSAVSSELNLGNPSMDINFIICYIS